MRGRIVDVAGHKIELVPHRRHAECNGRGGVNLTLIWDAYAVADPEGECLTLGQGFLTRHELVRWLRSPAGEAAVRQWLDV